MLKKGTWTVAAVGCSIAMLAILMIVFPGPSLQAALRGLSIWWDILFPSLFPFFVIAELMLGFGLVHFFGALLDPMMRPLFRVPGIGGFVMAMGFASGYPVGARLTSQLWDQRLINREEGERLVSFTTSSDPIFLIGAVCVGFFHDGSLALLLAAAHYSSCFLLGFLMRFHGRRSTPTVTPPASSHFIVYRAIRAMHRARVQDGRSLGEMLQDALRNALQLIMVVGGLVVFFCVVLEVLTLSHVMNGLYMAVNAVLQWAHVPPQLSQAVVNGLFEVTLGAKSAAAAGAQLTLVSKVAIAAFVLSWAGLSVHAQIVSLLSRTDLRYTPFVAARLLHGLFAAILVFVLWKPLEGARQTFAESAVFMNAPAKLSSLPAMYTVSILLFAAAIAVVVLLYAIYRCVRWVHARSI